MSSTDKPKRKFAADFDGNPPQSKGDESSTPVARPAAKPVTKHDAADTLMAVIGWAREHPKITIFIVIFVVLWLIGTLGS